MANLLNCTDIATVFLDTSFRIRRFTLAANELLNVIGTDVGRPHQRPLAEVRRCRTAARRRAGAAAARRPTKEVLGQDGRWYLRRIVPYRTAANRIDGVAVTFSDMTQIKQAAEQARYPGDGAGELERCHHRSRFRRQHHRLESRGRTHLRLRGGRALKMNSLDIIPEDWRPQYRSIIAKLQHGKEDVDSFETQRVAKDGRRVDVWVTATALTNEAGRCIAVAKTDRDITERKKAQAELQQEVDCAAPPLCKRASRGCAAILDAPVDAIITIDDQGIIDSVNPAAERMFGYTAAEMIGREREPAAAALSRQP